ncbi:MAG: hypothetical protein RBG13Loki_2352 [Promethearchaeota archaeon CR_4]|nr:MAG: hypothetical protein RBG13Loki_2352 [Candidatus Lokiarchaeota archaeon CR_4]
MWGSSGQNCVAIGMKMEVNFVGINPAKDDRHRFSHPVIYKYSQVAGAQSHSNWSKV